MLKAWIAWRWMSSPRTLLSVTTLLSFLGLIIGVGSLVVGMAVVSGYESTLKRSVIDVYGHMMVVRRGGLEANQDMMTEVGPLVEGLVGSSAFVYVESILAHQGKISGVILEGLELESLDKVIGVRDKLIEGSFAFDEVEGVAGAIVGKGLAQKFELKVGDRFRLVTPVASERTRDQFRPRMSSFYVSGIVDLGRYDYDSRYVATDLKRAQDFAQVGERVTGFRLKFSSEDLARPNNVILTNQLGGSLWVRDWIEMNSNLFEAIRIERMVIFFILLVIVIAASFNIASTLYVSVVRRFHDISILKAMGASEDNIRRIFIFQGLLLGAIGSGLGLGLGLLACRAFLWIQDRWEILPKEVYKLDKISLELRWVDISAIFLVTLLICFLATRSPAKRAGRLSAVEGLRFE